MKYWFYLFALLLAYPFQSLLADADVPQIPSNVVWMYVFLQSPDNTGIGSGKEVATMITPEVFRKNFTMYRGMAKQEKKRLIVTAETKDGLWVQDQIEYKGENLQRAPYYNPGIARVVPGAEIPLD
jgi:hypothetical protein